jgi:hypothetical protein
MTQAYENVSYLMVKKLELDKFEGMQDGKCERN